MSGPQFDGPVPMGYPATVEGGTELSEIVGMLRRRLWLVGLSAAVGLGVAYYRTTQEAPRFRSAAVIRLADVQQQLAGGIGNPVADAAMGGADPLLSHIQVLKSRSIATAVVDREGLRLQSLTRGFGRQFIDGVVVAPEAETDTVRLRFLPDGVEATAGPETVEAPYGEPLDLGSVGFTVVSAPVEQEEAVLAVVPRDAMIRQVQEALEARPRDRTDVIDVAFTHSDPHLAREVVDATIEVFQEQSADNAQQQSRRRRQFVEEQLIQTDGLLADAQLALSEFRSREKLFSSQEQIAAEQTELMQVDMRREELQADRRVYESLLRGLQTAPPGEVSSSLRLLVSAPGIASNPVIAGQYGQLVQYEVALDSLTTGEFRSASTHPDVQRLNGLVASTSERLVEAVRSQLSIIDARLSALADLRSSTAASIETLPQLAAEEARLTQRVETLKGLADQLREEHQKARITEAVEAGQVEIVDRASTPVAPLNTGGTRQLAFGLIVGLMFGSGGVVVLERLNTRIRKREELESVLRVPGLAVIPRVAPQNGHAIRFKALAGLPGIGGGRNGNGSDHRDPLDGLVTVSEIRSAGAEAYRTLRTNLIFSQAVETLKTVVVTSAIPGEGKTTTAANLAVAFAQQGMRVLLVDCDLRRPRLDKVFDVPRDPGLTDLLARQGTTPQQAIRPTAIAGLDLLPSGALPPNPSELLGGSRMESLLKALAGRYDTVVLDTPPLLAAADASVLGAHVDGVIMVVRAGATEREAALRAVRQLEAVGARVVGAVLNDPDAKVPKYGKYDYYYEYYGEKTRA